MSDSIGRRGFLTGSMAAAAATGLATDLAAKDSDDGTKQEFYELRIYRCPTADKQNQTSDHLEQALIPALKRQGVSRVGAFTSLEDDSDNSIYLLSVYPTLNLLGNRNSGLAADKKFQQAAAKFFAIPKKDPAFTRIESRLMKAFSGIPVLELSDSIKQGKPRMFELRIYESHNEQKAALKVAMFNEGEIEVMRDVSLAPVFFGETLISGDVPNLTYLLSADDLESHKAHFQAFLAHPEWLRMKKLTRFKDTVSKITSVMLKPTSYSEI